MLKARTIFYCNEKRRYLLIQRNKLAFEVTSGAKRGLFKMKGRHKWGFISGYLFKEITFGVYMFLFILFIPVRFENMREHQEEVSESVLGRQSYHVCCTNSFLSVI